MSEIPLYICRWLCHVATCCVTSLDTTRIDVTTTYQAMVGLCMAVCRVTSLLRNTPLRGPYSRTIPRVLWWSYTLWGGGLLLTMLTSDVQGYLAHKKVPPVGTLQ